MRRISPPELPIGRVRARCFRIPTEKPESDGTIRWDQTTLVLVEIEAGGETGIGFTYASSAAAAIVADPLAQAIQGRSALAIEGCWQELVRAVRNVGRPGVASMAVSAVDCALWDLKSRLLGVPLHALLGPARESAPVYGSGGFTSYTERELAEQLEGWVAQGIPRVKMKVGREPAADPHRVARARRAIGAGAKLFVDANGAYSAKQALALGEEFARCSVSWFEEPVSSDDLEGLALLRARLPGTMDVAAGEYGFDPIYFRRMLAAGAVDVLQIDATRCGGITGFLKAAALAESFGLPISSHCAPSMHVALGLHCAGFRHLEYFHDHVRIERRLFEGALVAKDGALVPDATAPGFGLRFKERDAIEFAA